MGNTLPRAWTSLVLVVALGGAACRTAAPPPIRQMPDPTLPPMAGPPVTVPQLEAARAAVASAESGDLRTSAAKVELLPANHPLRALVELEVRFLKGEKVATAAQALATANPGYASGWALVALAARRDGDVSMALDAARTAARLQPDAAWARMAADLERGLAGTLVTEGQGLLQRGDARAALARAREAMQVAPSGGAGARLLAVRALLALGDARGAAELLPALPDSGAGLELKGKVAEALGQWDLALDFYTRLPADNPRRCELLATARQRWRMVNAPPFLSQAFAARPLSRRGLAAIIAWEVPTLGQRARGAVPVFEDVVTLQERREVVEVARAGVLPGDPIARRWAPERIVSPKELGAALGRLARALDRPAPVACADDGRDCIQIPDVVDGESAAALVRQVAGGGGEPCAQR